MDRREFIKVVGLASLSLAITPYRFIFEEDGKEHEDWEDWFRDNKGWLKLDWIKPATDVIEDPCFKMLAYVPTRDSDELDSLGNVVVNTFVTQIFKNRDLRALADDIVRAFVFGKEGIYVIETPDGDLPVRQMSGFYEQVGRLPTRDDKVLIYALEKNWIRRVEIGMEATYVAECAIVAVEGLNTVRHNQ